MEHSSRHQSECAPKAICKYNHQTEEKHFWHLCDGPGTIHPGSQFTQNGSQSITVASALLRDKTDTEVTSDTSANSADVVEVLKCKLGCSINCYTTMQDKENCAFSPSLVMPLNNRNGDGIYRVRTLIDSGSGSNWIAKDILPKIHYTLDIK